MRTRIEKIDWSIDTDDDIEEFNLPTDIVDDIDIDVEIENIIVDYLSDTYGFCVEKFLYDVGLGSSTMHDDDWFGEKTNAYVESNKNNRISINADDIKIDIIKTPEGHVIDVFSNDYKLLDSMTIWND